MFLYDLFQLVIPYNFILYAILSFYVNNAFFFFLIYDMENYVNGRKEYIWLTLTNLLRIHSQPPKYFGLRLVV